MLCSALSDRLMPHFSNLLKDPDYHTLIRTHYSSSYIGDFVTFQETQMCQVLAWLLDPREGHNQQDYFLKQLLVSVFADSSTNSEEEQRRLLSCRYLNAQVFTELVLPNNKRMDIVVTDRATKTVVVIERKDGDKARSGQLSEYREFIENNFKDWTAVFVLSDSREKTHVNWDDKYVQINDQWLIDALREMVSLPDTSNETKIELNNILRMIDDEHSYAIEQKWMETSKRLSQKHQLLFSELKTAKVTIADRTIKLMDLSPDQCFLALAREPKIFESELFALIQDHHYYLLNLMDFYAFEQFDDEIRKRIPSNVEFESEHSDDAFNFSNKAHSDINGWWPYYLSLQRNKQETQVFTLTLVLNKRVDESVHWAIDVLFEKYNFPVSRRRKEFRLELLADITSLDLAENAELYREIMQFYNIVGRLS